jgi:uncharacterized protein YdgA (DUF945 family)
VNKATRTLLAIGGIVVLAYPGVAWVTGIAIESRIQRNESEALAQVPYLTLVKREYRRGVYRSTEVATYGFHFPLPQAAAAAALPAGATITVTSHIVHGPFPGLRTIGLATVDSTVSAPPALQKALAGVLGSRPVLRIHTTIGLLGGARGVVSSPAFRAHLAGGSTLAWGGLSATFTGSGPHGLGSGRLTMPRLAFHDAQGRIELTGIAYSGSYRMRPDELEVGSGKVTFARIDGSSAQAPAGYSLRQVSFTSTSSTNGGFYDLRVDLAMDAARFAAVRLKNVAYSESVEHVDGASLASMEKAIRQAELRASGNPAQLKAGLQAAVRRYGVDLLLHDPVVEIRRLSFTMPEGSLLFSAKVSAPGLTRADLQWPAAILALKQHAQVTADLRVDDGLVQKLLTMGHSNPMLAARLTAFEQQGYLSTGSGAVSTHLVYDAGTVTLNGHPFPPAAPAVPPAQPAPAH